MAATGMSKPAALARLMVCSACLINGASIISIPPFPSPKSRPNAPLEDAWEMSIWCSILAARSISELWVSERIRFSKLDGLPFFVGTNVVWMVSTCLGWIACWSQSQCQVMHHSRRSGRGATLPLYPNLRASSHSCRRTSSSL